MDAYMNIANGHGLIIRVFSPTLRFVTFVIKSRMQTNVTNCTNLAAMESECFHWNFLILIDSVVF